LVFRACAFYILPAEPLPAVGDTSRRKEKRKLTRSFPTASPLIKQPLRRLGREGESTFKKGRKKGAASSESLKISLSEKSNGRGPGEAGGKNRHDGGRGR